MKTDIRKSIRNVTISDDKTLIMAEACFHHSLSFFEGHFPGHPLLPGIFQIALIQKILAIASGKQYNIARIINAKFLNEIQPGMILTIQIDHQKNNLSRITAILRHENILFAKISMMLE